MKKCFIFIFLSVFINVIAFGQKINKYGQKVIQEIDYISYYSNGDVESKSEAVFTYNTKFELQSYMYNNYKMNICTKAYIDDNVLKFDSNDDYMDYSEYIFELNDEHLLVKKTYVTKWNKEGKMKLIDKYIYNYPYNDSIPYMTRHIHEPYYKKKIGDYKIYDYDNTIDFKQYYKGIKNQVHKSMGYENNDKFKSNEEMEYRLHDLYNLKHSNRDTNIDLRCIFENFQGFLIYTYTEWMPNREWYFRKSVPFTDIFVYDNRNNIIEIREEYHGKIKFVAKIKYLE